MNDPIPENTTKQKSDSTTPGGIIVVLLFVGLELLMLGRLITSEYSLPIAHIVLSKTMVRLYLIASVAILVAIAIGIIKRFSWARALAITWYGYNAILSAVNYITFQMSSDTLILLYQQFKPAGSGGITTAFVSQLLLITMIFIWITGGLIIFYLYRKGDYFTR